MNELIIENKEALIHVLNNLDDDMIIFLDFNGGEADENDD